MTTRLAQWGAEDVAVIVLGLLVPRLMVPLGRMPLGVVILVPLGVERRLGELAALTEGSDAPEYSLARLSS